MPDLDPEKSLIHRYRDYFMIACHFCCMFCSLLIMFHYFMFPNSIYVNDLLPLNFQNSSLAYLLIGIFYTCNCCFAWMTELHFDTMAWMYFFFIILTGLREITGKKSHYNTTQALREPENLIHTFRCVQILHKSCMRIFGSFVFISQGFVSQAILMSNYTLIRHWDKLDRVSSCMLIVISLAFQALWLTVLRCGGLFQMHSVRTLKSWKYLKFNSKSDAKYVSKFRKSCKPLRIGIEEFFTIRRLTILKFMRGIVKGTFRALLTLENIWFNLCD